MLPLSKIVLPVDFSQRSKGSGYCARTLACRFKAELSLIHVLPPYDLYAGGVEMMGGIGSDWFEARRADANQKLSEFMAEEFSTLQVQRELLEGDPAGAIVRFAHDHKADLIVMPTHGYGPFRRFILGSVAAKVLHDADCPVFTGAHLEDSQAPHPVFFRKILCAVDLNGQSAKAFTWAANFAREFNAELKLVHILPPLDAGEARYFDGRWHTELRHHAEDRLAALQQSAGIMVDSIVEHGEVSKTIRQIAGREQANLVVIGRHTDDGIAGRLRAHSYAITRESPCAVVSV